MTHSATAFTHRAPCRVTALQCVFAMVLLWCVSVAAWAQPTAAVELTPEEAAWRQQHPVVRVGVYAGDHLPAEAWVAGRPQGLAIDYMRLLATRIGMRLEFRAYTDWAAVNFAEPGQTIPYDLLSAMPVRPQQRRFQYLKPFGRAQAVMVARKGDLQTRTGEDLARARIAVDRANRDLHGALLTLYPDAQLMFANSNREALELVAAGRADAFVGPSSTSAPPRPKATWPRSTSVRPRPKAR